MVAVRRDSQAVFNAAEEQRIAFLDFPGVDGAERGRNGRAKRGFVVGLRVNKLDVKIQTIQNVLRERRDFVHAAKTQIICNAAIPLRE